MACHASKLRWSLLRGGGTPLSPAEAFHLATAAGAAALGLKGVTGLLEPGAQADFLVVDPRIPDPARRAEDAPERILARLLYRSEPAMIRTTLIGGRPCHGTLPTA